MEKNCVGMVIHDGESYAAGFGYGRGVVAVGGSRAGQVEVSWAAGCFLAVRR